MSALRVGQWLGNRKEVAKVERQSHYSGSVRRNKSDDEASKSKIQNYVYQ